MIGLVFKSRHKIDQMECRSISCARESNSLGLYLAICSIREGLKGNLEGVWEGVEGHGEEKRDKKRGKTVEQ